MGVFGLIFKSASLAIKSDPYHDIQKIGALDLKKSPRPQKCILSYSLDYGLDILGRKMCTKTPILTF